MLVLEHPHGLARSYHRQVLEHPHGLAHSYHRQQQHHGFRLEDAASLDDSFGTEREKPPRQEERDEDRRPSSQFFSVKL